jgi:hypothetical protein
VKCHADGADAAQENIHGAESIGEYADIIQSQIMFFQGTRLTHEQHRLNYAILTFKDLSISTDRLFAVIIDLVYPSGGSGDEHRKAVVTEPVTAVQNFGRAAEEPHILKFLVDVVHWISKRFFA